MSAASIGVVLIRPMIKTMASAIAKLRLPGGRSAVNRALNPLRSYNPDSISNSIRNAIHGKTPAYAVGRLPTQPSRRFPFHPSSRSYSTTRTTRPLSLGSSVSPRLRSLRNGNGPTLVSRLGLNPSPARQFSSSGAQSMRELGVNVPIGFRALAEKLRSDEDRLDALKKGRKSGRVMKNVRKSRKEGLSGGRWKGVNMRGAPSKNTNGKKSFVQAFNEYFPCEDDIALVSSPVNTITNIVIPLASSLTPLFAATSAGPTQRLFDPDPPKRPDLLAGLYDHSHDLHMNIVTGILNDMVTAGLLSSAGAESWNSTSNFRSSVDIIYGRTTGQVEPEALRITISGMDTRQVRTRLRNVGRTNLDAVHIYEVPMPSERSLASSGTSSFHSSLQEVLSDIASTEISSSRLPSQLFSRCKDDITPSVEARAWRMPVLDFSAQVPVEITQQDIFGDDGIWDEDVNPSETYDSFYASDVSMGGSGWSSPADSDVMSVSDMCSSDEFVSSR